MKAAPTTADIFAVVSRALENPGEILAEVAGAVSRACKVAGPAGCAGSSQKPEHDQRDILQRYVRLAC